MWHRHVFVANLASRDNIEPLGDVPDRSAYLRDKNLQKNAAGTPVKHAKISRIKSS